MKLTFVALMLFLIGCTGSEKKESLSMPGTYKMVSVNIKGDKLDTTYNNSTQLKIYTEDFMMYANVNAPDSVGGFGIGTYSVDKDTVTENVIYNANDSVGTDNPGIFKLAVEKTPDGYKQFIAGMQDNAGQKFDMTETYQSVGTGTTTAIDGAWKLIKSYYVNGKDSFSNTRTQFKTYFSGYVIWGESYKDSLNKIHTAIGFGKFNMPAANKVKESIIASTYYEVRGHDFDIDMEMTGKDGFTQIFNDSDSSRSVEVYERLKK